MTFFTKSFNRIKLARTGQKSPATPRAEHEGLLVYDRDGAVDGHLYLARKKSGGTFEWLDIAPGVAGPAPADAKYIVQTADGTLTNEQALSALATGILKNTTTTGVLSIAVGSDLPAHTHPIATDISGLGANVATFLATPSSANLAAAVTDETGTGALVLATGPSLSTPVLVAHLASSTTAMGFTALAAAGSTASTTGSVGTDVAGFVQIVPNGAGIAAGSICTLTFGTAYANTSYALVLTPASSAARTLGGVVGPTARTTTTVDLATSTALTAGSTYQWTYHITTYG